MKRAVFPNRLLPYLLVLPQIAVTGVFFFWPALESVRLSVFRTSPFGDKSFFVGLENFRKLLTSSEYYSSIVNSFLFAFGVTAIGLGAGLLVAALATQKIRGLAAYRTAVLWPYGIAPPIAFYLLVVNLIFSFFGSFGVIHAVTQGGPGRATEIMVFKVYNDGLIGLNLGSSAAQSVLLMLVVIALTAIQFRFVEKRVTYS